MTKPSRRKVLISGASIAGPALGYWLNEYGFDVTIVERSKTVRTGGYPIDVRAAALDVVDRMGILPGVKAAHIDSRRTTFLDPAGQPFAVVPMDQLTGGQGGRDLELPRGALTTLLYEVSRRGVTYRFSDSIRTLKQHADGVTVTFNSGAEETFDLVFGTDGLHSNTRKLVFGQESQFERYLGYCFGACTIPNYLHLSHEALLYNTPGKSATLFSPADSPVLYAFLSFKYPRPPDIEGLNTDDERKLTARVFADGGWEIPKMVDAMMNADDFFFDTVSQIRMPKWSDGRVALAGDAAHATSFMSGQGSSMALIGAYVLAGELASHSDHTAAFEAYERVSRSYIEANQDLAAGGKALMLPETEEALRNRNEGIRDAVAGGEDKLHGSRSRPVINSFRLPNYANQ